MTETTPHPRRIEEASLNAWPALHQLLLDGWVLRFARGFTRRANSIVPLYESRLAAAEKISFCENLYARERLTTIFRLTSLCDGEPGAAGDVGGLDAQLEHRGYRRADPTLVLARPIDAETAGPGPITLLALAEWLEIYGSITGAPRETLPPHRAVLNAIRTPHALAALDARSDVEESQGAAACGLGVLENELLGLFDVATRAELRRRGYGRALVNGLLHWGARAGARFAYLQVLESNATARRLYAAMGFLPLYRYWYRIAPE